jgi:hypothetical protein
VADPLLGHLTNSAFITKTRVLKNNRIAAPFAKPDIFLRAAYSITSATTRIINDNCNRENHTYRTGLYIFKGNLVKAGKLMGAWEKIMENTKPIKKQCKAAS